MRRNVTWGVLGLSLLVTGCRRGPEERAVSAPDAGVAVAPPDAGALAPFALDLSVSLVDGGVERAALLGLELPVVAPGSALVIEANRPLRNARLRILDEQDRALASDDVPEDVPGGWRYRVQLLAPLEPGHHYAVLLDPQSGAVLDDGLGHDLPEQRLEFRTSGERERPRPAVPARRKHRRH